MIRKCDNLGILFQSNNINVLNLVKNKVSNKSESPFNKNISNKRNKNKAKKKEKNKNNLFKTINLLQHSKKAYKNIKQPILIKNNKNEINIKLNLNYALLNNINNINNIQKYNNVFNNQLYTNNYINNSNSLEEILKEKEKSSKRNYSYKKSKQINSKIIKKKKNLSQINLTNLINNKCKINTSLPKNKSTTNINVSKNSFNKRYNSEKNSNNFLNKKNNFYENNFTNIATYNNANKVNSKNICMNNQRKKAKNCYNNVKNNYNKKKNSYKWANSYEYKNIYKTPDIACKNKNYKTPRPYIKNNRNNKVKMQKDKNEDFNLLLLDEIYHKTKTTLERFKNDLEMQIKNKI